MAIIIIDLAGDEDTIVTEAKIDEQPRQVTYSREDIERYTPSTELIPVISDGKTRPKKRNTN